LAGFLISSTHRAKELELPRAETQKHCVFGRNELFDTGQAISRFPGPTAGSRPTNLNSQENAHGRSKSTSDAGHPGLNRADQQRNGAHRPRRLPLAHLRIQANTGRRPAIHRSGHVDRHLRRSLLCLATAVAYAEISKLYPGTGSSYYYAEQAMLSKDKAFKYARVAKFIVGWGSHLYYWVYPGVMVAVTGIFVGYVVGFLYPNFMSGSNPGPVFMALVALSSPSSSPGSPRRAPAPRRPSTSPST
jgi:hypothetical protein